MLFKHLPCNLACYQVEHHDHAVVSGRLAGENMTGAKKVGKIIICRFIIYSHKTRRCIGKNQEFFNKSPIVNYLAWFPTVRMVSRECSNIT